MGSVQHEPSDRHVAFPQGSHDLGEGGGRDGGRRGKVVDEGESKGGKERGREEEGREEERKGGEERKRPREREQDKIKMSSSSSSTNSSSSSSSP